jgi:hypothetical protein
MTETGVDRLRKRLAKNSAACDYLEIYKKYKIVESNHLLWDCDKSDVSGMNEKVLEVVLLVVIGDENCIVHCHVHKAAKVMQSLIFWKSF